ncbi:MAG TPA: hypothetical protein VMT03_09605 [Polyangia bacterium]|nr:hypothetical protein [Polyangia bacterium]
MGLALFLAVASGASARQARAEARCPAVPAGVQPQVALIDGRTRLEWIDRRLSSAAPGSSTWNWGWAIGIGAAGVGTLIAAPFVSPDSRVDYYTGAGAAALGVLPFILAPPQVIGAAHDLHAKLLGKPPVTDDEVCDLLADAENKLVSSARNTQLMTGWYAHLGNLAFNTGIVLFEGLLFHRWKGGLINGVAGFAVGEAVIFTQPRQIIRDREAYDRGDLGP